VTDEQGKVDIRKVDLDRLLKIANHLVYLLDDAEVNHGGLYSTVTLRGRNDLRLELNKWSK
jgi:hypothetical protein